MARDDVDGGWRSANTCALGRRDRGRAPTHSIDGRLRSPTPSLEVPAGCRASLDALRRCPGLGVGARRDEGARPPRTLERSCEWCRCDAGGAGRASAANSSFQLLSSRCERASPLVTSDTAVRCSGDVFSAAAGCAGARPPRPRRGGRLDEGDGRRPKDRDRGRVDTDDEACRRALSNRGSESRFGRS